MKEKNGLKVFPLNPQNSSPGVYNEFSEGFLRELVIFPLINVTQMASSLIFGISFFLWAPTCTD